MAEWMAFWEIVKKSGHTEKEIEEEVKIKYFFIFFSVNTINRG